MNLNIGQKINQWSHNVRQEDLNSWSKILNDPNPIHFDANVVKKIGQGDKCINQGPANIAYIINAIFYNFPKCKILSIKNRLNGNVFVDDTVTVLGEITNISSKDELNIISLLLTLNNQKNNSLVLSEVELIQ
tara:strand:+ start:125 stop:523 length:399 start_codon:yes stop_codon:yes gene_type:complete